MSEQKPVAWLHCDRPEADAAGNSARGGSGKKHYLEDAADLIESLQATIPQPEVAERPCRDPDDNCPTEIAVLQREWRQLTATVTRLEAAQTWVKCSERLPAIEEYPDDTEIRGAWKSATGVVKSTEMLAKHLREFPTHYLAWMPLPAPPEAI